jgi:hypothetical protein
VLSLIQMQISYGVFFDSLLGVLRLIISLYIIDWVSFKYFAARLRMCLNQSFYIAIPDLNE